MDIEKANVENDIPSPLPKGRGIFSTFPDFLFIPEILFGIIMGNLLSATPFTLTLFIHGYVLAVCCLCFLGTLALMVVYALGAHKNANVWTHLDVYYHFLAAALYISAGSINAIGTQILKYQNSHFNELNLTATGFYGINDEVFLSLPCVLNGQGLVEVVNQKLTDAEVAQLKKSADTLWSIQKDLKDL